MVPKEFRKSLTIWAGCVTLLEAIVWGAWCVYSIGVLDCVWDFIGLTRGVSTWNLLYITYYMGSCRGQQEATDLGFSFTPPSPSANSLLIWMWTHTVLSVLWIPACLLLVGAAVKETKGSSGARLYYPWIALDVIIIFFDFAGAIYHLVDIFQTSTADDYAKFTAGSSSTWSGLTLNSSSQGVPTWLPSLMVTLFFCRFAVLWMLNIYFVFEVYKASFNVSQFKSKFIQNLTVAEEQNKSWVNPSFETDEDQRRSEYVPQENQPISTVSQGPPHSRYRTDEFGIPVEEMNSPRSQQGGRVFDFTGRPLTPDSFNERWPESPPPIASGIKIPPQLDVAKPFSYTAGDQPQLSRSNSRSEYPHIPRPDYTLAERRAASLEYVPNRFRVPSPKRVQIAQNPFNFDPRSPTTKTAPMPPKKPQVHQRTVQLQYSPSIPEDSEVVPQSRYISQQTVPPNQQQAFITRQTSQKSNYTIDKLY